MMSVTPTKMSKKDKRRKRQANKEANPVVKGEEPVKRVKFDLSMNKVTEFFKYGKVATRTL